MPSRNIIKEYAPNTFYHLYNRGVNKENIFYDRLDYQVFLGLLKRHLQEKIETDPYGRPYKNFYKELELLAYCLMPNHFHLLFYQYKSRSFSELMRRVSTSYVSYFNKRHSRIGALFQNRYKASRIDNETYLWHISRYIHLNPLDINQSYREYQYSSYGQYVGGKTPSWLRPSRVLEMHLDSKTNYSDFVSDFKDYKATIAEIKLELA